MKDKMKKIFASLLAAMMIFTYMPAMAFADSGDVAWNGDHTEFVYNEHTYTTVDTEKVDPTCTEDGKIIYKAMVDGTEVGRAEVKDADALGHDFKDAKFKDAEGNVEGQVDPTCSAVGYFWTGKKCARCGEVTDLAKERTEIAKTDHVAGEPETETVKAATKDEHGLAQKIVKCTECGEVLSSEDIVLHYMEEDKDAAVAATCTEDGKTVEKCTVCGETEETVIPALKHSWKEVQENTKEATCTEDGSYDLVVRCERCGEVQKEEHVVVPALGHDLDPATVKVTKEPTCTAEGEETGKCLVCKKDVTVPIEKIDHSFTEEAEKLIRDNTYIAPTCTEPGEAYYAPYCTVCGAINEEEKELKVIPPTGHDWKVTKTLKEATCDEPGLGYAECSVCGEKFYDEEEDTDIYTIPALNHGADKDGNIPEENLEITREDYVPATCTEEGSYTEVTTCKLCGKVIDSEDVTVPKIEHAWKLFKNIPATCEKDGSNEFKCEKCNETKTETLDKLGHKWEVLDETLPTCAKDGLRVKKCATCGKVENEVLPKLTGDDLKGHDAKAPVKENIVPATCGTPGYYDEVVYCAKGDEVSRVRKTIPAGKTADGETIEHTWVLKSTTTAPVTCKEDGEGVYECSVCKKTKTDTIDAHKYGAEVIDKAATCTEKGQSHVKCSVCGDIQTTEIPATGHKMKADHAKVYWNTDPSTGGQIEYVSVCQNEGCKHTESTYATFDFEDNDFVEAKFRATKETTPATCQANEFTTYTFTDLTGLLASGTSVKTVTKQNSKVDHAAAAPVVEDNHPATCKDAGYYYTVNYCQWCGKEISRQKVDVPKTEDHTFVTKTEVREGLGSKDELWQFQECSVCGKKVDDKILEYIDVKGHTAGEPVLEETKVEPTCTEEGWGTYAIYCTDEGCNEKLYSYESTIPTKDHNFELVLNKEESKEATATVNGLNVYDYVCKDCGETYTYVETEIVPSSDVAAKAAAAKAAADAVDPATYPEDQQAAVKAAKAALTAAAQDPNATEASIAAAKAAFDETMAAADKAKDAAAKADYEAAVEAAADAQVAAKTITSAKYTDSAVKAVSDANTKLDTALKSGSVEKIKEYTAALKKATENAELKAANPLKVKAKTLSSKATATKKFSKAKAFKVSGAKGKVTFKKVSGNKKISVSKAGMVTVKKGLKKGKTYKVKVKVTAAGNGDYLKGTKTVTLKIKVK